jgi:AraC-like DNA-binding protein
MAFAEARCNLLHLPFVNMDGSLHKGKEYVFLDLNFPPVEIEGVAGVFPFAGAFAEKLQAKTAAALYSQPCSISFALLEMVYAILLAQYPPQVQAAYLQIKAAELLFEVLLLASLHQAAGEKQTVQQYTSLVEARNFIETHFDEHLTIRKIAKKFGMNSTSFKTGFKQEFGMGAYEFLVRTRMTKASKMLKERKLSIQQIGLALGYSSGGSFIRVYKRYFKQTPLQMRKLLL